MYSRETELRHVQSHDVYKLGVILDENDCWKKLMEIIPKEINSQANSADGALNAAVGGFKYNNGHIGQIENAIKRPGESRLLSEILFDEWGTSGRKNERPTVGVLLQLLVKAELFRAADYVALHFLNEPPPERPLNGPAARIDISLPSEVFDDIEDYVNDSSCHPGTENLYDNANYANSIAGNNIDLYTKYKCMDKQVLNFQDSGAPVPPPRTQRSAGLLVQQQQQTSANEANTAQALNNICFNAHQQQPLQISLDSNLPAFSKILPSNNISKTSSSYINSTNTSDIYSTLHTESTNLSEESLPMLSVFGRTVKVPAVAANLQTNISALNLNDKRDEMPNQVIASISTENQSSEVFSSNSDECDTNELPNVLETIGEDNDEDECDGDVDDDDDDDSHPNLSIFDQRSSNNDSSLTNVTGTSGENSFELNDCSSASNDNMPCLSILNP